ncbi:hypothetical protein Nepgr_004056 [Nepenthes gracilis]|uniref:Uncharacterized protein n=1 Tax=Nepenthes gracilis TaxID=150966 RepID=A0AAD3XEN4_NEPGR|nr:hypothetical protein Nepgr_004056 [Nepenthes gracilis]
MFVPGHWCIAVGSFGVCAWHWCIAVGSFGVCAWHWCIAVGSFGVCAQGISADSGCSSMMFLLLHILTRVDVSWFGFFVWFMKLLMLLVFFPAGSGKMTLECS